MANSRSDLRLVAATDTPPQILILPCSDCDTLIETSNYCRWFWYNLKDGDDMIWEPTDKVESRDRCASCQEKVDKRRALEDAERARNSAIAEAKREEIRRRIEANKPTERQIGFDMASD